MANDIRAMALAKTGRLAALARAGLIGLISNMRRETPLLPEASIAGRSLVIIIAIMTFLASLTAGTVELVSSASDSWRASIAREVTVQLRPISGRDTDADVAAAAALVRAARAIMA